MKLKRIFALIGAVLLAGLFILAIILAAMGAPKNYLMAVIFSLVFIPIILYAMGLMTRVLKPSDPFEDMDEDVKQPPSDKTDADSDDEHNMTQNRTRRLLP